jgi:hypothetical protein
MLPKRTFFAGEARRRARCHSALGDITMHQVIHQRDIERLTRIGLEDENAYDQLIDESRSGAFTRPERGAKAAYWVGANHEPACSSMLRAYTLTAR